jgi:hypothetical protein
MKKNLKNSKIFIIALISILHFGCSKDDETGQNDETPIIKEWSKLGGAIFNDRIQSVISDSQGNVYVAGRFKNTQGKYYVAKWDGVNWTQLGDINVTNEILCLIIDNNNNIYASGRFNSIKKWNGSNWIELNNNSFNSANTWILRLDNQNNLYAGTGGYVYKWNGSNWSTLGDLFFGNNIMAMTFDSQNNLYVGGSFTLNGKNIIRKWNGSSWSVLPLFDHQYSGDISSLVFDNNNNLFVTGTFLLNLNSSYIPKWNGSSWSNSFSGFNSKVHFRNNKLFAFASSKLYELNNQNWNPIGNLVLNGSVYDIWFSNNNIYLVGWFTDGSNYLQGNNFVAKYNF